MPHDLNTVQAHVVADTVASSANLEQSHEFPYHMRIITIGRHLIS